MKWTSFAKAGTYAYAAREMTNLLTRSRRNRLEELQHVKNMNMVLGMSLGAVAGIAAGILVAPRTGRETRGLIASQTREIMESLRQSAYETREELDEKGARVGADVRQAAESAREAVREAQR